MKKLKTIIKNVLEDGDNYGGGTETVRHVLLAYQWIKRKDLTLAENPERTVKCVRINLLAEIINFLVPNKVTINELDKYLKENRYKTKNTGLAWTDYTIVQKYTNKEIFNNHFFFLLSEDYISLREKSITHFVRMLFRKTPINPVVEVFGTYFTLNFKNSKGSHLILKIQLNQNISQPIEYTFILKNKTMSQGLFSFPRVYYCHNENETFDHMIEQLLKDEKFGEENESK